MEKSIFTKQPWTRRLADGTSPHPALAFQSYDDAGSNSVIYTQRRMLDEYYPTSHDIYNKKLYPDILREVDETYVDADGVEKIRPRKYVEPLPRTAFSYQQIIETKRTDHLCGNDVTFERNWSEKNETREEFYRELVDGWEFCDMEDAVYQFIHQSNIVADAALVGYLYNDEFGQRMFSTNVFSFFNGDDIYAHRDTRSGRVRLFARKFTDEFGRSMTEVWDDKFYYLFIMPNSDGNTSTQSTRYNFTEPAFDKDGNVSGWVENGFYIDGYNLVRKEEHLFPFCPVAYRRLKDGPVWVFSQDSIEAYEEDFNGMRHNNKVFGEPIMAAKGDDVEGIPELDGTIKYISMGKDDDVKMLQGQSAAESYVLGLDKTEELIYLQSFIVKTPELKSGDLPAAALRIIYSPAVEKAMHEVKEIQPAVNAIVNIFRWGWGMVKNCTLSFQPNNLPLKVYLKPFVHQSESSMVVDINTSVNNGTLSKRTGSERLSGYLAEENEWERIVEEKKEQEKADLLYETALARTNKQTAE